MIDIEWFRARLADKKLSQRRLALALAMDPAAVSRQLNGTQSISLEQASDMARILGVDYDEMLRRLGVTVPRMTERKVPVAGTAVGPSFEINFKQKPRRTAPRPIGGSESMRAVLLSDPGRGLDNWIVYYTSSSRIEIEAVGRWCVVETADGKSLIKIIRHGFERGKWQLENLCGDGKKGKDVFLASAAPILWVLSA